MMALPNDPLMNQPSVTNAKLSQMWDIPRGNQQTVLAVIDTGFGLGHEEFAGRWATNGGESGATAVENPSDLNCADRSLALDASCNLIDDDGDGVVDNESGLTSYQNPSRLNCTAQGISPINKSCNRIDDDGNGYVDDMNGWDFINNDNSSQAGELNPVGTGTTHGTLVAGTAAATGNNAKGIAGVDWDTKILPLQALDDDSYGDTRSVGRAIYYAISRQVDVINLSLGSSLSDSYVEQAVRAATAAGIIVVAAAGNDGCDCMVYPANYPEVVAVGALDTNNAKASFSSFGPNVDIVAPGTQITAPTWRSDNATTAYSSGAAGTSFSSPIVAGMITRLISHQPSASPLQLIAALTENTNRLSIASTVIRDNSLGFGGLDALKATQRLTIAQDSSQQYVFSPVSRGAYLNSGSPAEQVGSYAPYQCASGTYGSTPIYEMSKSQLSFFTVSQAEAANAKNNGYTSSLFSYACLQQPHDTVTTVRNINLYKEFRNDYSRR